MVACYLCKWVPRVYLHLRWGFFLGRILMHQRFRSETVIGEYDSIAHRRLAQLGHGCSVDGSFFSLVLRPVEVVFGPFAGVARP